MAAGLPVVGFAQCPGVNELVRHHESGLLAPEMTSSSLAETLRSLLQSPAMRKNMGDKGRELAMAYTPQVVYDAWETLLRAAKLHKGKTNLREETYNTQKQGDVEFYSRIQLLWHCMERPNLLVGDGNLLRRFIFSMPWLLRRLRPLYAWLKGWRF